MPLRKGRIRDLAGMIERHEMPLVFDMSTYAYMGRCGTSACIAGWAVFCAYGDRAFYQPGYTNWAHDEAARILGLNNIVATELFCGDLCAPAEVAVEALRHLARTGEVDWARARNIVEASTV